jgi:phage shock protein PspC (stress-responsive transcriptional regulator)
MEKPVNTFALAIGLIIQRYWKEKNAKQRLMLIREINKAILGAQRLGLISPESVTTIPMGHFIPFGKDLDAHRDVKDFTGLAEDEIMADCEPVCDAEPAAFVSAYSEASPFEVSPSTGPIAAMISSISRSVTTFLWPFNFWSNLSAIACSKTTSGANPGAPKRLYRIPAGEWIMGVCNGLAAYFNVDVTLMRIIWILLTIFTHGFWIVAYIVLAIVMPPVRSEEQYAEAHGWTTRPPLNANDFIEETKKRYAQWRAELEKMHEEHKAKEYGTKPSQDICAAPLRRLPPAGMRARLN